MTSRKRKNTDKYYNSHAADTPFICHFWFTIAIFRPVKSLPKKCVNLHTQKIASRQKSANQYWGITFLVFFVFGVLIGVIGVLVGVLGVLFGVFSVLVGVLGVLLGVLGVLVGIFFIGIA